MIGPRTAAVRIGAVLLIGFMAAAWGRELIGSRSDPSLLDRDWTAFHRAGRLLLEGETREIYGGSFGTRYPYLYPPFVLYACAPLGLLPPTAAYAGVVTGAIGALVLSFVLLRKLIPGEPQAFVTAILVVLASAPWNGTLVVGQISPKLVFLIAAGFAAWKSGRPMLAGVLFAVLLSKPNYGLVIGAVAISNGGRRMVAGWCIGTALLLLSTVPLGPGVWQDYIEASRRMGEAVGGRALPLWKHQTIYAFWLTTLGDRLGPRVVQILWVVSIAPLLWGLWRVWRGPVTRNRLPLQMAVTVLFLVAANPYCYFYDGLLLMIPGVVWYVMREEFGSRGWWRVAGGAIAAGFVWQHVSLFGLKSAAPWALAGPLVYLWFVAAVVAVLRSPGFAGESRATNIQQRRIECER